MTRGKELDAKYSEALAVQQIERLEMMLEYLKII